MSTTARRAGDEPAGNIADHAADTASHAIRSTQQLANRAFDRANDRIEGARETVSPALDRWSAQAESAARRSMEAMRDKALRAHDVTTSRIQDDPLKSVLIAAAAGAVLVALLSLFRGRA